MTLSRENAELSQAIDVASNVTKATIFIPQPNLVNVSGTLTANTGVFDLVEFNNLGDPDLTQGQLAWNNSEGSLALGASDTYAMFLGEELHYRIRNNTGSTLLAGTAVYATGLTPGGNNRIEVGPYTADGNVREVRFMGLMTEDCNTGLNGYATHFGYIRGIDTRGDADSNGTTNKLWASGEPIWNEGDILYVHPSMAGKLTKVEPQHSISVAIILNRHANQGKLFVRPTSYGHLADNHDVNVSGLVNNNLLVWNSDLNSWEPSTNLTFDGNTLLVNGSGNIAGDMIIGGNITIQGSTVFANVSTMEIEDPIIALGLSSGSIVTNTNLDRGLAFALNDNSTAFMGWDVSENQFSFLSSGVSQNSSGNYVPGTYGDLRIGELTATAASFSSTINAANLGAGIDNSVVILDDDGKLRTDEIDSRVWGNALVDGSGSTGGIAFWMDNNTLSHDDQLFWDSINDRLGIGTSFPSTKLDVAGSGNFTGDVSIVGHLSASTKSFLIDHPTKKGKKLQYGSLESPYHGVRLTGKDKLQQGICTVKLPCYLKKLVKEDEINIQITNYKHSKTIYVDEINIAKNFFVVRADRCKSLGDLEFFWSFTAVRKDVPELLVEKET